MSTLEELTEALGALWTEPEDDRDLADWKALPQRLLDALKSKRVELVELPEGDNNFWWHGDVWCSPGSGRIRVALDDSRLEVADARDLAASVLAAAVRAEGSTETRKCYCDGGSYEIQEHPFLVNDKCPIHGSTGGEGK